MKPDNVNVFPDTNTTTSNAAGQTLGRINQILQGINSAKVYQDLSLYFELLERLFLESIPFLDDDCIEPTQTAFEELKAKYDDLAPRIKDEEYEDYSMWPMYKVFKKAAFDFEFNLRKLTSALLGGG